MFSHNRNSPYFIYEGILCVLKNEYGHLFQFVLGKLNYRIYIPSCTLRLYPTYKFYPVYITNLTLTLCCT